MGILYQFSLFSTLVSQNLYFFIPPIMWDMVWDINGRGE